jgi:Flp pilus assembly protein TadG
MAFVSLICLVFMFALFEYGRIVMMLQILDNAARVGCRQAVVTSISYTDAATATTAVQGTVTQALAGQRFANASDPVISIYQADTSGNNIGPWTAAPFGRNIVVQVDGDYPLLLPTFGFLPLSGAAPNSIHLSVKVMMRSEAN